MYLVFVKICKFFVSLTLAISALFSFTPANKEIAKIKGQDLNLPKDFTVTAHAGAMLTRHNSISSLKQILETDIDIVEIDVSFRPDGTPVIIHNSAPKQRQGVIFLDALKLIAGHPNMQVNLDLKAFWNLPAVLDDILESDMQDRVFFTGVSLEEVDNVRKDCPGIPYYLNVSISDDIENENMLNEVVKTIKDCGAIGINLNHSGASRTLCEIMHKNGLLVSVWTVDKRLLMHKVLSYSPDNITTKRPNKLIKIIDDWGK